VSIFTIWIKVFSFTCFRIM